MNGLRVIRDLCRRQETIIQLARAEDGTDVVYKRTSGRNFQSARERLRREYAFLRRFDAPAVVRALDFVEGPTEVILVLSYRPDLEPLDRRIAREGVELGWGLRFGVALSKALGQVHAGGVIHRDLNPSNILVSEDGKDVVLIDFGIASERFGPDPEGAGFHGTLAYVAPEQTGRTNRFPDYRSDYYALGATLYEVFTGRPPFRAEDAMGLVHAHLAEAPIPPSEVNAEVPKTVSGLVLRLLEKAAADRYQSSYGLRFDLERCLRSWSEEGHVPGFCLGGEDRSESLVDGLGLYARDSILEQLEGLLRVARAGSMQWAAVTGPAGIGKSRLLEAFEERSSNPPRLVLRGRFEAERRHQPYHGPLEALRSGLQAAMTDEALRDAVEDALGPDASLLIELLPEVGWLLGPQAPGPEVGAQEARRLLRAFARLFEAFASPERPLLLMLDDVQWADRASIHLLEALRDQAEARILVILAYRAGGPCLHGESTAPFAVLPPDATLIAIQPLENHDVRALIEDTVGCAQGAEALADLIHNRARGNPAFIIQLLRTYRRAGAVRIDPDTGRWAIQLQKAAQVPSTDGVDQLLSSRFSKLPRTHQVLLGLAASIGSSFDFETLIALARSETAEVKSIVGTAAQEGFVVELGEHQETPRFRFIQDDLRRIAREAVRADREDIHLRIARLLLAGEDSDLLEVASHVKQALPLIVETEDRKSFNDLLRRAAERARSAAAFDTALDFLVAAEALLGEAPLEFDSARAFVTRFERADLQFLVGATREAAETFDALQGVSTTRLEATRTYARRISCRLQLDQLDEALDLSMNAIRGFGVELRRSPTAQEVGTKLQAVLQRLNSVDKEALSAGPPPEPELVELVRLIGASAPAAYLVGDGNLFVLLGLTLVELALEHGPTSGTAYGLSAVAVSMVAAAGAGAKQYAAAEELAQLAYRILDHQPDPSIRVQVDASYLIAVRHWNHPAQGSLKKLFDAFEAGYAAGEIVFSGYCLSGVFILGLCCSAPLDGIIADAHSALEFFDRTSSGGIRCVIASMQRLAQALRDSKLPLVGVPEGFGDESTFVQALPPTFQFHYLATKMLVAFLSRDYAAAEACIEPITALLPSAAGDIKTGFFAPLAGYVRAHLQHPEAESALDKGLAVARNWARGCPENGSVLVHLLESERFRREGNMRRVFEELDAAVDAAAEGKWHSFHGFCCETAAELLKKEGRSLRARGYVEEARAAYQRWGATRLVERLEARWPEVFSARPADLGSATSTIASSSQLLDLLSILKASRLLSSEVEVGKLLHQLMGLLIENAGADHIVLVRLEEGSAWWMASARHQKGSVEVELANEETLADAALAPLELLSFVQRSERLHVVGDITQDRQFGGDPFFEIHPTRAVVALPLLRNGRAQAALYLGNSLAADAFTPPQLSMLDLLASQMAISLENALMYENLERIVERKTLALARRERSMQLVLDSMKDGLLECRLDGRLTPIRSRTIEAWFGKPDKDVFVWDYLVRDADQRQVFELAFEALSDEAMPFGLTSAQMAAVVPFVERGGVFYGLSFRQVFVDDVFDRILVGVRDITEELARERAESRQRDLPTIVNALVRDRGGFSSFMDEVGELLARLETNAEKEGNVPLALLHLHTLKGNTAVFGFGVFSRRLHEVETQLAAAPETFGPDLVKELARAWAEESTPLRGMLAGETKEQLHVRPHEYQAFQALLQARVPHDVLAGELERWRMPSVHPELEKLARHGLRIAEQVQKPIEVRVEDNRVRVETKPLQPVFSSCIHVIRNALDHGIESASERKRAGKPVKGTLTLCTRFEGDQLVVEIGDDGRGINWDKVRSRAARHGIPAHTRVDLQNALFHEGLSTEDVVTELSGRGVGMAAVKTACVQRGGSIEIESEDGRGTTARIRLPIPRSQLEPRLGLTSDDRVGRRPIQP